MIRLFFVLALGLSLSAMAQQRRISASDYRGSSGIHAVSGAFGFYSPGTALLIDTSRTGSQSTSPAVSGFFGIGGDYEYLYASDLTFGGFFRYYSTSDSISSSTEQKVAAWTLSGMARAYFNTDNFAPYIGGGFGLVNVSVKNTTNGTSSDWEPSTTLGFNMAIGVLYKFNDQVGIGVENLRVFALGEKVQGMPINDFMFKGRFIF